MKSKKRKSKFISLVLTVAILLNILNQFAFATSDSNNTYDKKLSDLKFTDEIAYAKIFDVMAVKNLKKLAETNDQSLKIELKAENFDSFIKLLKTSKELSLTEIIEVCTFKNHSFNKLITEYEKAINEEYINQTILKSDDLFSIKRKITVFLSSEFYVNKISNEKKALILDTLFNIYQSSIIIDNKAVSRLSFISENTSDLKVKKAIDLRINNANAAIKNAEKFLAKNWGIAAINFYKNAYKEILIGFNKSGYNYDNSLFELKSDTDKDSLTDGFEFENGLNPFASDTDKDGLKDNIEVNMYPDYDGTKKDTDNNNISDYDEDYDKDGLSNGKEFKYSTDMTIKDSDNDSLLDGFEVNEFTTLPNKFDTDEDDLSDGAEYELGTNPNIKDTDGNGVNDGEEIFEQSITKNINVSEKPEINKVEVSISSKGNIKDNTRINSTYGANKKTSKVVGLVGSPVEINTKSQFDVAKIKFFYDETKLGTVAENDLGILWYDEKNNKFEHLNATLDTENNTISVETSHFSEYLVVDMKLWFDLWNQKIDYSRIGGDTGNGTTNYFDIVMAIDSSGSMSWNDPANYRITAAKNFVDSLYSQDQGAVVDFDYYGMLIAYLTGNKDALKAAIDTIDADGGTNIDSAVNTSIDELVSSRAKPENKKIIILLTDGDGTYYSSTTTRAINENITIYTVGLGNALNEPLLQGIAASTGGKYYQAVTSEELLKIFLGLEDDTTGSEIDTTDTDGDGLYDTHEINGMKTPYGIIYSDPNSYDTDGDSLSDGYEMGDLISYSLNIFGYNINYEGFYPQSFPDFKDSDGDYLNDDEDARPLFSDLNETTVYQSERYPGYNKDGSTANDMKYDDYSKDDITNINKMFYNEFWFASEDDLFSALETMSTDLFSTGSMEDVVLDMIDHFRDGTATDYSNSTLTEQAKNHDSTKNYTELVKKLVIQELQYSNGYLPALQFNEDTKMYNTLYNNIQSQAQYPRFSSASDTINGLTITVNDTWGNTVKVKNYSFDGQHFSGNLNFNIYDHFGLDQPDVEKKYVYLAGFRSWFVLQHYDKFNGKYKPFITNIPIDIPFHGDVY